MKLVLSLRISAGALLRHRLRTAFALAGLVIGVAVVLIMVGIGEGAKREVLRQIENLGVDLLVVTAGETRPQAGRETVSGRHVNLLLSDASAMKADCEAVLATAPAQSGARRVKFGPLSTMSTILGTTPEFEIICRAPVRRGRYFTHEENQAAERVAVVGERVVEKIFDGLDPIGTQIRVGSVPFLVIGILKPKGASVDGGGDEDNRILIPIKTAMRRVFNVDHLACVYVQTADKSLVAAESSIRGILRDRHALDYLNRADDFDIQDQEIALRAESDAAGSFTTMIIGLAAISLFVGGIGILSIMLITVKERVGEIGLRLAIGARPRDIIMQFMSESMMLGVGGGIIGLGLGMGSVFAIGELTEWVTFVPVEWIVAAMGASVVLGLGAGVYPAMRAAHMNPIDALRSE